MNTPLVSVIIPAFNAGPYISETIDSALAQTHRQVEVIVVDDGSTDDTPRQIAHYDGAVRYVRQEHAGIGATRNRGLSVASGSYVAFLDADDVWNPDTLKIQIAVAGRHPSSGLIVCDGVMVDGAAILSHRLLTGALAKRLAAAGGGELTGRFYRELIPNGITCPAQTLIPQGVIEQIGPMVTASDMSADWEYYLRIALKYPITLHGRWLVRYQYRPTGMSGAMDRRQFRWILNDIPVLRRQLHVCAPADRAFVAGALRARTQARAREAYYLGRRGDLAYAQSFLLKLCRRVPTDPVILGWLVALWLPERLVERLVGLRSRWRSLVSRRRETGAEKVGI